EDVNRRSQLRVGQPVQAREQSGWILKQCLSSSTFYCMTGTGEESFDVDPHQCCGQEADWRKNAESATDIHGDIERRHLFALRQFTEGSSSGIGGEHEVPVSRLS